MMVVLPGLGHESYVEAPEQFNAEVRSFVRSVLDTSRAGRAGLGEGW